MKGVSIATLLVLAVMMGACQPQGNNPTHTGAVAATSRQQAAALPLGEFAGAGGALDPSGSLGNPLANDSAAVADGQRLFIAMNCAGCHGYGAGGAMGPDLTDPLWRYGGTPAAIYRSIAEGRPKGMPAWGLSLPQEQIWKITAYVQSLGGTVRTEDYHAGLQGDHHITATSQHADAFGGTTGAPRNQDN